ncbi:MAG: PspC domain-containing protein [Candidatus Diapherotrites archaeon]|nr:PspC domain-containing protein [Candidatus Diapherotrites archaeon]
MPRKRRRARSRSDLGDRFGQFGEEVGQAGERFGRAGERFGRCWHGWFDSTFRVVGPVIGAIFSIICLVIAILALNFMRGLTGFSFFGKIAVFFAANLPLFFVASLFFSYMSYAERRRPRDYRLFSPVVSALGVIFAFWIIAELVLIMNASLQVPALSAIALFFEGNILMFFVFFAVLCYLGLLFAHRAGRHLDFDVELEEPKMAKASKSGGMKRLYRSGNEKILGGVCGGLAEYFGIDPVLVRLAWVLLSLAWGTGILLYIICWIIIPRNPAHRWN